MTVGQVNIDDMGIDNLNKDNLINYFIYGIFIFVMSILFINIFTGISIDEIQSIIQNSEAENISSKIQYVLQFEKLIYRSINNKPLMFLYIIIKLVFISVDLIITRLDYVIKKIFSVL